MTENDIYFDSEQALIYFQLNKPYFFMFKRQARRNFISADGFASAGVSSFIWADD